MNPATRIRKLLFLLTGKLFLADPIRNRVYMWAWEHLQKMPEGCFVCDIGSRDSILPSFLAWRGFEVTSVEPDTRFTGAQMANARKWGVSFEICPCDLCSIPSSRNFDCILSIFSLQHAGEGDIESYLHTGKLLRSGGVILTVNEFNSGETKWQRNRDDGDLRIYGTSDEQTRIEKPLLDSGTVIFEKKYASFVKRTGYRDLVFTGDPERADIVFIAGKRRS